MLHMTDAQHQKVQARRDELCTQDRKQIAVSIDRIFNSIPDKESKRWSWHTGYMGSMAWCQNSGLTWETAGRPCGAYPSAGCMGLEGGSRAWRNRDA